MDNQKTWLLLADAAQARIYAIYKAKILKSAKPQDFELITECSHKDSRKKGHELISDKQGEFGGSTFEHANPPKEREAELFALQLLSFLNTAREEKRFRDLILIASPSFMGLLNKHMHAEVEKMISQRIEKDYTKLNGQELVNHLLTHF